MLLALLMYIGLLFASPMLGYNLYLFVSYCLFVFGLRTVTPADLIDDFFPYKQESLIFGIPLGILLALFTSYISIRLRMNNLALLLTILGLNCCFYLLNIWLNAFLKKQIIY
jgi:hypothetical protein